MRWAALAVIALGLATLVWSWGDRARTPVARLAEREADFPAGATPPRAVPNEPGPVGPRAGGGEQPESETAFLAQLEELNQTDKPRALDWARRGDHWYGNAGAFAEARQAMQVTLLVDLGRMDEARIEAKTFIAAHPESRYRPLVQGATGIHPRPGRPTLSPR